MQVVWVSLIGKSSSLGAHLAPGPHIEDDTKSGLAGHHSLIGPGCIFEGQHLDHRCDSVYGAELQARLVFNRRAGEAADDRAAIKDEIGGVDLDRVVAHADDHQLTAWCEPG